MKCGRCGRENTGIARFCASCGSPLAATAQPRPTRGTPGRGLTGYFFASPKLLRLLPFSGRISGLLEMDLIRRVNPIALLVPIALTFLIGLSPSGNGHIESSPFLFQVLPIISIFNPFIGYLSAIAFAAGDIVQKLFYDDVYYGGTPTIIDWAGARIGFILSYSSVVTFGLLPGILARVFRNAMTRRQVAGRALDGGTATNIVTIITFILGGAIGAAISGVAALGLELPSFYMRQSPDVSCANVMITANVNGTIPSSTAAGVVGGIVGPIANTAIPKAFPPPPGQTGQESGADRAVGPLEWKDFGKGVKFPGVRALGDGGPTIRGTSPTDTQRLDPYSYTRSRVAGAATPPKPPSQMTKGPPRGPGPVSPREPGAPAKLRAPVQPAAGSQRPIDKWHERLGYPSAVKGALKQQLKGLPPELKRPLEQALDDAGDKVNAEDLKTSCDDWKSAHEHGYTSQDLQDGLGWLKHGLQGLGKYAPNPASPFLDRLDELSKGLKYAGHKDEAALVDGVKEAVDIRRIPEGVKNTLDSAADNFAYSKKASAELGREVDLRFPDESGYTGPVVRDPIFDKPGYIDQNRQWHPLTKTSDGKWVPKE